MLYLKTESQVQGRKLRNFRAKCGILLVVVCLLGRSLQVRLQDLLLLIGRSAKVLLTIGR